MEKDRFNIMVCDDQAGVREALKIILEKDYLVSLAKNGEEALELAQDTHPDLIILDVKMPKMNGLEALKIIKEKRQEIKVIMITGYESVDVASQALALGADDYIVKPFDRETVLAKVQKLTSSTP
jgi:YesN/AraC family two-component response regulator